MATLVSQALGKGKHWPPNVMYVHTYKHPIRTTRPFTHLPESVILRLESPPPAPPLSPPSLAPAGALPFSIPYYRYTPFGGAARGQPFFSSPLPPPPPAEPKTLSRPPSLPTRAAAALPPIPLIPHLREYEEEPPDSSEAKRGDQFCRETPAHPLDPPPSIPLHPLLIDKWCQRGIGGRRGKSERGIGGAENRWEEEERCQYRKEGVKKSNRPFFGLYSLNTLEKTRTNLVQ